MNRATEGHTTRAAYQLTLGLSATSNPRSRASC